MNIQQLMMYAVDWVRREPGTALMVAAGAYLILLVLVLTLFIRLLLIGQKQTRLLRGADGMSLERMLLEHADGAREVKEQISLAAKTSGENSDAIRLCLQRVGLVRYDAFTDVGGEQSFSCAILDGASNGLVVSGLYSRNDMRVYAKPVVGGSSPLSLTEEEQKAIANAHSGGPVTQQVVRGNGRGMTGGRR